VELATRKLPDVEALIARGRTMRDWLRIAPGCSCETLDLCGLFEPAGPAVPSGQTLPMVARHDCSAPASGERTPVRAGSN
jgi:hypothetical protein